MMNMDKVICIGYFVAGNKKNNDVFLHWQHREKCPEAGPLRGGGGGGGGQPERRPRAHEFRVPQAKRGKKRECTLSKANKIKCVFS